jgi:hypothetical protein
MHNTWGAAPLKIALVSLFVRRREQVEVTPGHGQPRPRPEARPKKFGPTLENVGPIAGPGLGSLKTALNEAAWPNCLTGFLGFWQGQARLEPDFSISGFSRPGLTHGQV